MQTPNSMKRLLADLNVLEKSSSRKEMALNLKSAPKNTPAIPVEILHKILDYLSDDKDALAQCMRVSRGFNSIAIPLLYRSIELSSRSIQLFAPSIKTYTKPRHHVSGFHKSPSPSPKANEGLNHIRVVVCGYHKPNKDSTVLDDDCDMTRMQVPVLRLETESPWHTIDTTGCKICRGISKLSPRKLVFQRANNCHLPNAQLVFPDLETTVSVVRYRISDEYLNFHLAQLHRHRMSCLKRSIVILTAPWHDWSRVPIRGTQERWWSDISRTLFQNAQREGFPDEMVLVNFEGVAASAWSPDSGGMDDESLAEMATRKMQEAYLAGLGSIGTGVTPHKTDEDCRKVRFKFVSMTTYLAEYDWEGELTEEQVKLWLLRKGKEQNREMD